MLMLFPTGLHWKKKWSHFDLKSWVTGGTKFDPGLRVIGEYLSKIDSILRVNFEMDSQFSVNLTRLLDLGRILVSPLTQLLTVWMVFRTVAICIYRSSPLVPLDSCLQLHVSLVHVGTSSFAVSQASDLTLL